MNKGLKNILSQLDLIENDAVFYRDNRDGKDYFGFDSDTQKKLDVIKPNAYYVFNRKPFILFFDLSDDQDKIKESLIHRQVWSFDNSPIIFVIKELEIKVFNALSYTKQKDGEGTLQEILLSDEELKDKFSFWNLQSGLTWDWFQSEYLNQKKKERKKRVNERLFQNIKEVRKVLVESEPTLTSEESNSKANSLILRLIFIRYLIDRGVKIDKNYIEGKSLKQKRLSFSQLIADPIRLNELFKNLNDKFNGVLFKDIDTPLTEEQAYSLSGVFKGETPLEGSLFYNQPDFYFEIFDFSIIPVEVISGIYESLISPETRKLDSAVYTPSFLVEYILEDTVQKYLDINKTSECKIFEVAVGSGIFLVQSLRKMIEKEKELNKNASKDAFNERIREITKNNLFGIDINKEALKVTCFSIYIALLDYQNPKEIDKYKFPHLLDENLFEANFFDTEHKFNNRVNDICPNYILGNPPWKSNKDEIHLNWLKKNNKTVGRFEIAQSFLLRSKDFMAIQTKTALIVTSTIFYNISKPTKDFKREFLTSFCVDKFFDLSPVRRLIFEEKNSPASVVYYRKAKSDEEDNLTNLVSHLSIKSNTFLKHLKSLVIEKFDQKKIMQRHFIENDWMFKVALYGNTLDFRLFKKLEKISDTKLIDLIDGKVFHKGAGIERGAKAKFYGDLIGLPIIENRELTQDFFKITEQKLLDEENVNLSRGRDKRIFIGNKILFKEQCVNESEPLISFTEDTGVFRKGVFSITSVEDKQIKVVYAILKSVINYYFLFLKSAAWGTATRPAIRFDDEILSFPYRIVDGETRHKIVSLVNKFIEPMKKRHGKFSLGEPALDVQTKNLLDNLILDLYDIKGHEIDLIHYALEVSRFQFQESKQYKFLRKVHNDVNYLRTYAEIYLQEFEEIYVGEYMSVEIYPLDYFIAMNFIISDEKPEEKIIAPKDSFSEREVLKRLADNLSISQITNMEDPTKNLYIQKDIKGFEANSFYIIKPNEFKSWHRAMAWYDVAEFKQAIEEAEINLIKE